MQKITHPTLKRLEPTRKSQHPQKHLYRIARIEILIGVLFALEGFHKSSIASYITVILWFGQLIVMNGGSLIGIDAENPSITKAQKAIIP